MACRDLFLNGNCDETIYGRTSDCQSPNCSCKACSSLGISSITVRDDGRLVLTRSESMSISRKLATTTNCHLLQSYQWQLRQAMDTEATVWVPHITALCNHHVIRWIDKSFTHSLCGYMSEASNKITSTTSFFVWAADCWRRRFACLRSLPGQGHYVPNGCLSTFGIRYQ